MNVYQEFKESGLSAIFEQAIKQIKNLQKLDRIEDDF